MLFFLSKVLLHDFRQSAEQTRTSAKVSQHTVHRIVSLVIAKVRVCIAKQVEHHESSLRHAVEHMILCAAPLPELNHPFAFRVCLSHCLSYF